MKYVLDDREYMSGKTLPNLQRLHKTRGANALVEIWDSGANGPVLRFAGRIADAIAFVARAQPGVVSSTKSPIVADAERRAREAKGRQR